ncbi:hypothetical protein TDB9533_03493 [Thalassocella blandensis]|nr:hypothetical protein TDB9533_03493 [Thalassocella blandensis]
MNIKSFGQVVSLLVLLIFSDVVFATQKNSINMKLNVSYASELDQISIEAKEVPLHKVLEAISVSTGVEFVGAIDDELISSVFDQSPLIDVIDRILKNYNTAKVFLPVTNGSQVLMKVTVLNNHSVQWIGASPLDQVRGSDLFNSLSASEQQIALDNISNKLERRLAKFRDMPEDFRLQHKKLMGRSVRRTAKHELKRMAFKNDLQAIQSKGVGTPVEIKASSENTIDNSRTQMMVDDSFFVAPKPKLRQRL